ncbi:RNA polymerase sigma factor [Priestia filamentosa]|uniref:RNA polymerase sigma factor n=1 Tax=Priestia filamentosa TaxID=1402861 RepID=UPI00397A8C1F
MEETQLINRAQQREKGAFEHLMEVYEPRLQRIINAYALNKYDLEDIKQETIIRMFISLPNLLHHRPFTSWMKKIAIHTSIDFYRKKDREIPIENVQEIKHPHKKESEHFFWIAQILDELDKRKSQILSLKIIDNYTFRQISHIGDLTESTVKSHYYGGIQKLKTVLAVETIGEVQNMLETLKEKAVSMFSIPSSYDLLIEQEYSEEILFAWEDKAEETGFMISFHPNGELLSYSREMNHTHIRYAEEALYKKVLKFLHDQTNLCPSPLFKSFAYFFTKSMRFEWIMKHNGYKIDNSGFFIDISYDGYVINFKRYCTTNPRHFHTPQKEVHVETVKDYLMKETSCNLFLSTSNNQGKLVYKIEPPFYSVGVDEYPSHPVKEEDLVISKPLRSVNSSAETIEEMIGLTNEHEYIRESKDPGLRGKVFRKKNLTLVSSDKSIDNYMRERNDETIKIQYKENGKIKGIFSFENPPANLRKKYNRKQGYERALQFLEKVLPSHQTILRFGGVSYNTDESWVLVTFYLTSNIPFEYGGMINVNVCRKTLRIVYYMEPETEVDKLLSLQEETTLISATKAKETLLSLLEVEAVWKEDEEKGCFTLHYQTNLLEPNFHSRMNAKTGELLD